MHLNQKRTNYFPRLPNVQPLQSPQSGHLDQSGSSQNQVNPTMVYPTLTALWIIMTITIVKTSLEEKLWEDQSFNILALNKYVLQMSVYLFRRNYICTKANIFLPKTVFAQKNLVVQKWVKVGQSLFGVWQLFGNNQLMSGEITCWRWWGCWLHRFLRISCFVFL